VSRLPKLNLADMKALLPPVPVLATESLEQFEKVFDQVLVALHVQDMVELILIRNFALPSWELDRYTRHRVVAFDRKFKGVLQDQVAHLQTQQARREALARKLAEHLGQRPPEVGHLVQLENQVIEAEEEIHAILKRTPTELAYNRALERSIAFHKDLEFLITSITKRRDQALEMLERYRQGLGKRAKEAMEEILDAEYQVVDPTAPALVPPSDSQRGKQDGGRPFAGDDGERADRCRESREQPTERRP
jgi:hypothetical protein